MSEQDWTSAELLARYRQGEPDAGEALFERYVERLTRLARTRLSPQLARRTDPDDVVMSAWRSFFLGARSGKFELRRSGDLWRLLVSITMHKLYRQVRRHSAEKRDISVERSLDALPEAWSAGDEPRPEEAVALADELQAVLAGLSPPARRVLELRLRGESLADIAEQMQRSERTVRRLLGEIRGVLARRLECGDE